MTDECITHLIEEHAELPFVSEALREGLLWKERYFKILERCENLLDHESDDAIDEILTTLENLFKNER